MAKFELFQSEKSEKYYFRLKAINGQVILASEAYDKKAGAENGIQSVKINGILDERFIRKVDRLGNPYFILKAANGQSIGKSEKYSSKAGMEKGIQSVKNNLSNVRLKIVDLTPPSKVSDKPIESARADIIDFDYETSKEPFVYTFTRDTDTTEDVELDIDDDYLSSTINSLHKDVKFNYYLTILQFVLIFLLSVVIIASNYE